MKKKDPSGDILVLASLFLSVDVIIFSSTFPSIIGVILIVIASIAILKLSIPYVQNISAWSFGLGYKFGEKLLLKSSKKPPALGRKLLIFFIPKDLREELIGDLDEEFTTIILPELGAFMAKTWYLYQVIKSILATNKWIVWVAGGVGGVGGVTAAIGAIFKRKDGD